MSEPNTLKETYTLGSHNSFESSSGLTANVTSLKTDVFPDLTINGIHIPKNTYITAVHFKPSNVLEFDPEKMMKNLSRLAEGITEMLQAIEHDKFRPSSVFIGHSNLNMALVARKFGFKIVDQCKTADGKIRKDLKDYTVVGSLDEIIATTHMFKSSKIARRIEK